MLLQEGDKQNKTKQKKPKKPKNQQPYTKTQINLSFLFCHHIAKNAS